MTTLQVNRRLTPLKSDISDIICLVTDTRVFLPNCVSILTQSQATMLRFKLLQPFCGKVLLYWKKMAVLVRMESSNEERQTCLWINQSSFRCGLNGFLTKISPMMKTMKKGKVIQRECRLSDARTMHSDV